MPNPVLLATRFRPKPRVLVRRLDAQAVLLDLDTTQYFSLNDTGRRVWELLAEGHTVAAALDVLATEFEAPLPTLTDDVEVLVGELEAAGLLERLNG